MCVGRSVGMPVMSKCVGGITWTMHMLIVSLGQLKLISDTRVILCARAVLAWTNKKRSLRYGKLKVNRASETEDRGKKAEDKTRNKKTENHKKQRLATLKRLKRSHDNELERNLRLA